MKRLILIVLVLLLLAGIGVVVWTVAGLPPVRMVWSCGLSYHPEPTGRTLTVEGVELVEIGPGCFLMGAEEPQVGVDWLGRWCSRLGLPWGNQPESTNEMPVHWVEFKDSFWIADTEVTNSQFEQFDEVHHRVERSAGDNHPVVEISWDDAKRFCAWASTRSGLLIRLPSEAQWECACRAGSATRFCFGDDDVHLSQFAWHVANSDGRAHEVATLRPNNWGLFDLHGNAFEWCEDTYHPRYVGAPTDGTAWITGGVLSEDGEPKRVVRVGCWMSYPFGCRASFRAGWRQSNRRSAFGFRPAIELPAN